MHWRDVLNMFFLSHTVLISHVSFAIVHVISKVIVNVFKFVVFNKIIP